MAVYFRVHPDKNNRDIFDSDGKLYDADFNEVEPEVLHSNDVLVTASPEEFESILSSRR
jgi:hypothetical protein